MDLQALRDQLARIDQQLMELVAKRDRVARDIGSHKRHQGAATRDYAQERTVIERARTAAKANHISENLAEQVMRLLIRSSLTIQEQDSVKATKLEGGKRALVIGGLGRMGQWFARFLSSQGYQVDIADTAAKEGTDHTYLDYRQTELDHDVIVVAAPLVPSNTILTDLAELKPPGLVFDVGSLKSPLRSGLEALVLAGVRATSIHPMFGPDTELLSGRHVVVVDVGVPEANNEAAALFASTMVALVDTDLENHDRLMAYVLGLSHAINIAFATALAESGENVPKLADISSTTFDAQLQVATRVAQDNPDLYFEIQSLNDYGPESLSALLHAVERLRSVVRAGDKEGFTKLMERGKQYFSERSPNDVSEHSPNIE